MEQLLLKMDDNSDVKIIAASAYNFRIELVKKVGKDDIPGLVDISHCMADRFGNQVSSGIYFTVLESNKKLIQTKKTQERIKHTLATGKPLVN